MLDRDTGCLTPLSGYFWLPMNQPVHPLRTGGKPFVVGPVPVPIQEVMLFDSKIFFDNLLRIQVQAVLHR